MAFVLTEKRSRALRRLLRADGASPDAINNILGDYQRAFEAYDHFYNHMTKADRDRLFTAVSRNRPYWLSRLLLCLLKPLSEGAGLVRCLLASHLRWSFL